MGLIQDHLTLPPQRRPIRRLVRERAPTLPLSLSLLLPNPPNAPTQEHALEVLALPGVPSAVRYTALPSPNPPASPYLITYEFPSLSYTTHPSFTAVANTPPPQPLVDRIYAHAAFDIRFYAELPAPAPAGPLLPSSSPAGSAADKNLALASIALDPVEGSEAQFLLWFAKGLAEDLGGVEGFVGLRRFEYVSGVLREGNVVSVPGRPGYLVLVKFERAEKEEEVRGRVQELVAKGGLATAEVGWFGVKRVWREGEVEKLGEAP